MSKLQEVEVLAILASTEKGIVLAERYDVTPAQISNIRQGKSWSHLGVAAATAPHGGPDYRAKLTDEIVAAIRASDKSCKEVADEYGVSFDHVWKIKNNWIRRSAT